MLRLADERDIPNVVNIARQNKNFIGFVMNVTLVESIKKKSLYVYEENNKIVGFVHFHKRLDGWTTLHEIAVDKDNHSKGIGTKMMSVLEEPIRLKTTQDNVHAVSFYEKQGFAHSRTEPGKKRELLVFEKISPELKLKEEEKKLLKEHLKKSKKKAKIMK